MPFVGLIISSVCVLGWLFLIYAQWISNALNIFPFVPKMSGTRCVRMCLHHMASESPIIRWSCEVTSSFINSNKLPKNLSFVPLYWTGSTYTHTHTHSITNMLINNKANHTSDLKCVPHLVLVLVLVWWWFRLRFTFLIIRRHHMDLSNFTCLFFKPYLDLCIYHTYI